MSGIKESPRPSQSMHHEEVHLFGAVLGAGASTPTIPATTSVLATDNNITSTARTSEGLYVLTFRQFPAVILDIIPTIMRASGAFKHVNLVSFSVANMTVTIQVMLADGSGVDDVESTDTVRVAVYGRLGTYS